MPCIVAASSSTLAVIAMNVLLAAAHFGTCLTLNLSAQNLILLPEGDPKCCETSTYCTNEKILGPSLDLIQGVKKLALH